jgi:hypothetical protein
MFSCTNSRKDADGNQIIDNELFEDSAISIQPGNPVWMSPDIGLNDPSLVAPGKTVPAGRLPYLAEEGVDNLVTVRVRKAGNPVGTTSVFVDLFVAPPSLNPAIASSQPIFSSIVLSTSGLTSDFKPDVALTSQSWTAKNLPANSDPINPSSREQHFCLVARCYPSTKNPPTQQFCVGQDPHVAQRNIMIKRVVVGNRMLRFSIQTRSNNLELSEQATIRAFADRIPSFAVLSLVLPSLQQVREFRQITQITPLQFALQLPERFSPVIRDNFQLEKVKPITSADIPWRDSWRYFFQDGPKFNRFRDVVFEPMAVLQNAIAVRKFNTPLQATSLQTSATLRQPNLTPRLANLVEQAAPTYEADIQLPPQEIATFEFTANLPEQSQAGNAHIFHVMHINENQQVIGGLTIVAVVVDSMYPELVDQLTQQRSQLVKNGYLEIFGDNPPHGNSSRQTAACLRDLGYYFDSIINCCKQGNTEAFAESIAGIRETNQALGYPNSWFATFYQSIRQNHGLSDSSATIVNSYLDYAISALS